MDEQNVQGTTVIVRLTGGLCNQMFMYAFGRSLSLRRNEAVQFHWCRSTWDYALDRYNTKIDLVKLAIVSKMYTEPGFAFDPKALDQPSDAYFCGYWQTEKYFEKHASLIRQELTLKEPACFEIEEIAKRLREENSVFIHVRRGDYLNLGTAAYHGNLAEGYYKTAIDYISEKVSSPKFYIFSDDPVWCRRNMPYPVVAGFNQHEDLYLMSQCRHGIGANSTFSWWANWLGEYLGRICTAPNAWFNVEADLSSVIPERWIKL